MVFDNPKKLEFHYERMLAEAETLPESLGR